MKFQEESLILQLLQEIKHALLEFDNNDEIRCIIITGNERAFAAGADIKQMESRGAVTTNPLLNPFAWVNFVKAVKSGAWKDQAWKAGAAAAPRDNVTRDKFFRDNSKKD